MSRAEDGRIAYQMKRPLPDGTTHLFFTGLELPHRVASLVPAVTEPGPKEESPSLAETVEEPKKGRKPQLD